MYNLVCRGSRLSFMLILCFAVPIIVETPFILHIWLGEIPEHSIVFLRIVMTMALIDSLSHTLIACMHASGKVRLYQIINSTFLFFTLPLSYFILKMGFPAYSAFIVSLLISCVCHIVRLGILNKTIGFPISRFLKDVTCKSLFLSVFCFSIPCIIRYNIASGILISIALIAMSFILTIICCYYIGLNYKEKVFVYNKFKDFLRK